MKLLSSIIVCSLLCYALVQATQHVSSEGSPLPRASAKPVNVDPKLDCAIKQLAWDFANQLLSNQPNSQSQTVHDALQLGACSSSLPPKTYHKIVSPNVNLPVRSSKGEPSVYADANNGDDSNPGTVDKPVKTVHRAFDLYRSQKMHVSDVGMITLAAGEYFLTDTIDLLLDDSNLIFQGDKRKSTVISGGKQYTFAWSQFINKMTPPMNGINAIYGGVIIPGSSSSVAKYVGSMNSSDECQKACAQDNTCFAWTWHGPTQGGFANMCYFRADGIWAPVEQAGHISGKKLNVMVADLSKQDPILFNTLFLNGRRAVRARYPDGNPETMGLHTNPSGYVSKADSWLPPADKGEATEIHIENPERNGTHFPQFQIGIGGPVSVFDPPESYWGTAHPSGGGGRTYTITTGMTYSQNEGFVNRTWAHPETGVLHTFHCGHWGNWQFAIKSRDNSKRTIYFDYGGFQEARGCTRGAEWYVENIFEELDAPGEWFYDETAMKLYLYPNGTLPTSGVGTALKTLFNIQGSMDRPVKNILFTNVTFAHTQTTFLERYEVPSGGDWAIHRGGAVFAEGVDSLTIDSCRFDSPGGNGLFLSNYIRNAVVRNNEFVWCGDSAIASIGQAELIDGTNGNQPRGNMIVGNVMHEVGIFGKQTSAYIQSLTAQTTLMGNVLFNGPRAGINFNDGFGGGHLLQNNLGFNMVRETGDHGVFNSWDRQPYLTKVNDSMTPSLVPAFSNLTRNFFINNYHSTWPIDHDDGSCYYYDSYNYLVYGGFKNYLGHSKIAKYNFYVYPDQSHAGWPYCAMSEGTSTGDFASGWGEVWSNNSCVIGNPNIYKFGGCDPSNPMTGLIPMTADNKFYAPNKSIYIQCKDKKLSLSDYQKLGYDVGSTIGDVPDTPTIIQTGKDLLGIKT